MSIRDIVREYLKTNGYDGLYNPETCACEVDALMPCDEPSMGECSPGYKVSGCEEWCGMGCPWHITAKKAVE